MKKVIPFICILIGIGIILEVFVDYFITKNLKPADFRLTLPNMTDSRLLNMDFCYNEDRRIVKDGLLDFDTEKTNTIVGFYLKDTKILSIGGQCRISGGYAIFNNDTLSIPESDFRQWNDYIAAEKSETIILNSKKFYLPVNKLLLHRELPVKVLLYVEYPVEFQGNRYKLNSRSIEKTFTVFMITVDEKDLVLCNGKVHYIHIMMVVLLLGISFLAYGIYLSKKTKSKTAA